MMRHPSLGDLHRRSRPPRSVLFFALASAAVGGSAQLLLLASLGYLLAWSTARPALGAIAGLLTAVELLAFFRSPLRYLDRLRSHAVAFAALRSWRLWLFDRLIPLSPAGLGRTRSGEVLATAMSDVDSLGDLYIKGILPLFGAVVPVVAGLVAIATLNVTAALIIAGTVAVGLTAIWKITLDGALTAERIAAAQAARAAIIFDALQGAATLTAANGWERPLHDEVNLRHDLGHLLDRRSRSTALRAAIGQALAGIAVIGAVGAALAAPVTTDPRIAVALVTMSIALAELVGNAATAVASLDTVVASWTRLVDLSQRSHPMPSGSTPVPTSPLALHADHVSLAYLDPQRHEPRDSLEAFSELSFDIEPGERALIVGPSGSGKSSVLIVVLGLWPRTSGDLHLNGVSFDDLDHDDVRRSIGSHLSSSSLFSGTVRSNLEMTGASSDEMRRVLDAVGLPPEVFLDRQLGERGRGLSGGEQLRVSIARALLSGRHAVVIDEPFAQLDEFSARQVERAIVDFARGRTIITTAHERGNDSVDVVVDLSSGR